jgi:alkanesulfonate monooxygenase SsuD/methylene tetrahydromethanopterin reductase-like flavin-dependent oxidoreductase (luciferase family)
MPRFGVTTFSTDYGLSIVDLARAVEERGLDSIFFNEHTHFSPELPSGAREDGNSCWVSPPRALPSPLVTSSA